MVGWTNATGDMLSFDSIVMTYTVGSSVYTLRDGKVYLNGSVVTSNLPFSIVTGGTNKRLWEIRFLKSGTAKFLSFALRAIDVFCVGGGGGSHLVFNATEDAGGGGGYTKTLKGVIVSLNTGYNIVIGAGGAVDLTTNQSKTGGTSSGFGCSANGGKGAESFHGGDGGSGGGYRGTGGTNGGDGSSYGIYTGGTGQHTTTKAFGDSAATAYGAGGSGVSSAAPVANTGHGGNAYNGTTTAGASGIVIVRNKR